MVQTTAVDIVIVPPLEVQKVAIKLNRQAVTQKMKLGLFEQLPHISLLMGGVKNAELESFTKKAVEIIKSTKKFEIEICDYYRQNTISGLEINLSENLSKLHRELMTELGDFIVTDNTIDSIYESETANPISLKWINGFKDNFSLKNYKPHITIGDVDLSNQDLQLPIFFDTKYFGIYHLGNYCTCTKLIESIEI